MIGKIFGSKKVIQAGIDAGDKIFFTDEEKSQWFERLMVLYEPFKITQRFLAFLFSIPYVLVWCYVCYLTETGADIDGLVSLLNGKMGTIVSVIAGFFFCGGMAEGIVKAAVKK